MPSQPRTNTRRSGNDDIAEMINSTYRGKENLTLKPYLRNYDNVQENVKAISQQSVRYQLIHEAKPRMNDNNKLICAPTRQSRLVANVKDHLIAKAAALKQKRTVSAMKANPKTTSINETFNSQPQRHASEARVAHTRQ